MMKTTIKNLMSLAAFIGFTLTTYAQTQKGLAINGEAVDDNSGWSVSMPDANTIAIGAMNNDGSGTNAGHVRVFLWNGSAWVQKGSDIDGEAANDASGFYVNMPDANTVAIGASGNDGSGTNAGHVRIFTWSGTAWVQKGSDINGEAANDSFGYSLNMPDANTIAIGATENDAAGTNAGHVRIFSWSGSTWVQKGIDIDGEASDDNFGRSVSMPDANTVAIGALYNDGAGTDAGHVRIFTWSGSSWIQKGIDIDGEAAGDFSGVAVSMPDANTLAVGASDNDGSGASAGHARIFTWSGSAWIQKGNDIDGEAPGDLSGRIVSMPDANTIAIGAYANDGIGTSAGHARIYGWNSTAWVQIGMDIDGLTAGDLAGRSVSMPDANTLAVGSPYFDIPGANAGQARIFSLPTLGVNETSFTSLVSIYPNPTSGELQITSKNFGTALQAIYLYNVLGEEVYSTTVPTNSIKLDLSHYTKGVYLVTIITNHERITQRILVN
ncbi:MAG: T9SS type A sorting domain-containing protein [Bacteroidetes bacterium]|nr:T9SS type A sorting domain-containing protein [Bacteroidota bacterium]